MFCRRCPGLRILVMGFSAYPSILDGAGEPNALVLKMPACNSPVGNRNPKRKAVASIAEAACQPTSNDVVVCCRFGLHAKLRVATRET